MLSGDNGVLQQATNAKTRTDEAQIKERIQLAYYSALTGGQGNYTKDTLMKELENEFKTDYDVDDSDEDNWILKAQGQQVTIPAGQKSEKKVVGTSSDWKLNDEKDTIIAYIGNAIDGDTLIVPNYVDDNKIISIGNGSAPIWAEKFSNPNEFMSGKKLKISEGIEIIKYNAFVSSLGLVGDLIIPESVIEIGEAAFASCNNMNGDLYIGSNVRSIGNDAFGSNNYSGNVLISNSVEFIGDRAFSGNTRLTVTIQDTSENLNISNNAFASFPKSNLICDENMAGYPWGAYGE